MPRKKRRRFTKEFKEQAVRIVKESGESVYAVAKDLDLSESVLRSWVRNDTLSEEGAPEGSLTGNERDELIRLRKKVKRLEMEKEILKKAAAFFAKENG